MYLWSMSKFSVFWDVSADVCRRQIAPHVSHLIHTWTEGVVVLAAVPDGSETGYSKLSKNNPTLVCYVFLQIWLYQVKDPGRQEGTGSALFFYRDPTHIIQRVITQQWYKWSFGVVPDVFAFLSDMGDIFMYEFKTEGSIKYITWS